MATIDDPAYRLREMARGAIAREGIAADRLLPLSLREAMTDAILAALAGWLTDERTLAHVAAALTEHEVDAVAGCAHHTIRDCQAERARIMAARLAELAGGS